MKAYCWLCGARFEPDPKLLREIGERGESVHNSLLDCPDCERLTERIADRLRHRDQDQDPVIPGNIAE